MTPAWHVSAVDGQLPVPSGWRHRLNVDFIPARLIGGESDEFAVGRDLSVAGASLSRANRNRLLASVQRKKSHSTRSQVQYEVLFIRRPRIGSITSSSLKELVLGGICHIDNVNADVLAGDT